MVGRRTVALLVALSLLSSVFLAGAQAQNETVEEDGNVSDEETYEDEDEADDTQDEGSTQEEGGTEPWVDCWDDEQSTGCEAVAGSREEADALLEEAEADGTMPFSLEDPNVTCQEDDWDDEVSIHCYEEVTQAHQEAWVDCWEDGEGPTCEASAPTREEAREALEQARADGEIPFALDDIYTECHTEDWDGEVRLLCTQLDSLVECWDEGEGATCEAWGATREEARAKLEAEADQLPFDLASPDVTCEEERRDEEITLYCFEEPDHEEQAYDEAPEGSHEAHQIPPECTSRPEEGVIECPVPSGCEDRTEEGRDCPPPECEPIDRDRVACPMEPSGPGASGEAGPQPDCRPADGDPNAMVCTPPPECQDRMGQTAACTPPPECEDQGDGTFLCSFEGAAPAPDAPEPRDAPRDPVGEEVRSDLQDAVHEALDGFRQELEELRETYQQGKTDLADRYAQAKDDLREDYRDCLDELGADADRVDQLEHELDCKQQARAALQEEREVLLAERDLLREDLLSQAETQRFHTCQNLQETLHGLLVDEGIFDADLSTHLGPGDLGLCASILLDNDASSQDPLARGGGSR